MRQLLISLGAAMAISTSVFSAIAASDPYIGEYVGNCEKAQCFIEITKKKGKNYHLRFTATDPMDTRKTLCKAEIPMKRDSLTFTAREQYADALVGEYKDDPLVWLLAFNNGSIHFYIENAPCGRFDMSGEYGAYGD
ncbi:hypothetical protein KHQ08_12675 [Pseudochrobactrum algeriensis]|uniref:hypothetical protein n=1 Tax=Pseudochrobactrum algeriensis TaxID=2834768 RepID=UPI001BD01546|nr:hypothetical protein [Pseudochrobactrum algeriensis]QVQ36032.1 hypothetical protein KHQ08_12675 [Pseudochrobactrum algeriensis]QVQ39249.1 hypothetical protein KHQ07_10960 [Pseudochrobactrum algeriensis]QVQ43169.1 hypothetical protein KHQ09_12920 [Pseudochrobactrum algeriensis]